jgi:hypothetical protein
MAEGKKKRTIEFRTTKSIARFLAGPPQEATTVDFGTFIHGQVLALPFTFRGFTFASPFSPDPAKVMDLTTYGEPALQNTWLSNGIALRRDGLFVQFPNPTNLCSLTVFPDLETSAPRQLRIEWFDAAGNLVGEKEFGSANPLPQYQAYTHVIAEKGIAMIAAYSNEDTPLCRVQVLYP